MDESNVNVPGIFTGVLLFLFAGFAFAKIVVESRRYKHISQWLIVEGKIVDNKSYREDYESDLIQITTYSYKLDGVEYVKTIEFKLPNFLGVNSFISGYKVGDMIDIRYDPNNPHESLPLNYDVNIIYEPFSLGFVFVIVGLISILLSLDL